MISKYIISYVLIFIGIVAWVLLLPKGKKMPQGMLDGITVFGGAFLLASCFINLVPHAYADGFAVSVCGMHLKVGIAVLAGFLLQLLLENLTHGVEHGHDHHEGHSRAGQAYPVAGLLLGLSIHAFLEGMPLVDADGELHQSLLYGIILHNIPIALVLVGMFMHNHYSFGKSLALLSLFAMMTPLGSMCNIWLLSGNSQLQALIMGLVVGILLHVSVSILFDHGQNTLKWWKVLLIIAAFAAAYFTPGCPEIYG